MRDHLNKSLGQDGLVRQALLSKSASFLSHPLPECSCRIPSDETPTPVKGNNGQFLFGGEEKCPKWMKHDQDAESAGEEDNDDAEMAEYGNDLTEQSGKTSGNQIWDQDEEMDPND